MNAGDVWGKFRIIRLIGRGAMGEVYLAQNIAANRQVALKRVYGGPDRDDAEILSAERLGAELQKRLAGWDRRVVLVSDYGDLDGDFFIEMEYIEGEDLSAVLRRGPIAPGKAAVIAVELCEMLENLRDFHTVIDGKELAGIVHGDLKPGNIRINYQDQVKVLDFGIAKALSHTRKHTSNLFASKAYCSPERLETQNMDTHSDMWAVGVMLYQMVSGRLPFEQETVEQVERRIRSTQPPDALPQSCPEPLRLIVFRMLARDPSRRYLSATDLRQDLQRFLNGEPILAKPHPDEQAGESDAEATVRTATSHGGYSGDATVRTAEPIAPTRARHPLLRGSVGCAAVVMLLLIGAVVMVARQVDFFEASRQLRNQLQTERFTSIDEAWNDYQRLNARWHLPFLMWGVKGPLKSRLLAAGDEPIAEYRNTDSPTVRETQWKESRDYFAKALELDPNAREIKGRIRLCDAQIERINAKPPNRLKHLNSAVLKFEEAADLLKHSPDPYLGLARLYVYDLNDMDRAEQALQTAEHYGHPMGNREKAQLADGYRRRADRAWKDARASAAVPDRQRRYLESARQDYLHADELYRQVGSFGDSARNSMVNLEGLDRVEQRLREMESGPVFARP